MNRKLAGSTTYTTSLNDLDPRLSELDKKINGKSVVGAVLFINEEITRLEITDESLTEWKKRIGDSFHAALVLRENRDAELRGIERAIRVLHVISLVKTKAISRDRDIKDTLTKTITVSKSIFRKAPSKEQTKPDGKKARENTERVRKAVKEYEGNHLAIKELNDAYDKDWEMRRFQQEEEGEVVTPAQEIPAVYSGVLQRLGRWLGILPVSEKVEIPASTTPKRSSGRTSLLADEITKNISKETKDRLSAIGSNSDKIEASYAITRLEEKNRKIARVLHSKTGVGATTNLLGGYAVVDDSSADSNGTNGVSTVAFNYMDSSEYIKDIGELSATAGDTAGDPAGDTPED
ncbi:MAG: hypothetical protein HOB18_05115, partial [Nitrospina sp.]|nr:hypothetical protein [Nitrospina sp.]